MNSKSIKKHLNNKLRDWISNIDDENIRNILKDNVIVTGGAIVSLLTGEELHDYDIYLPCGRCFNLQPRLTENFSEFFSGTVVFFKIRLCHLLKF